MNRFNILNSFYLKLFGIITMVIDHIGLFIFPEQEIFRIIGRIAFVIFAFQLVESMKYSKHKEKYILSLLSIDIVLTFAIYIFSHEYVPTVFAILGLSSLIIYLIEKKQKYYKILALIPMLYIIFATFNFTPFKVEYGIYGLLLIMGFYFSRIILEKYIITNTSFADNNYFINSSLFLTNYKIICVLFLFTISLICKYFSYELSLAFPNDFIDYEFQSYAFLAFPFILLYNGKRGYDNKYIRIIFYLSYPLSVLIPYLISILI